MNKEINFLDFTIAIATYNSAKGFPEVLDKLRRQTQIESINWEIIIIDNNSKDNTAQVFYEYQQTWNLNIPLRYIFEPEQGLAFARKRAFTEAKGELIGFLDDDNLPYENWIAAAYDFAQKHPEAGAFNGQVHGLFEIPPSEQLKPILPFLAIVERGEKPLRYEPNKKLLPPGAGLVIRKQAWLETVPKKLKLTGRVNKKLVSGEDIELLSYIQQSKWEIWYNPAMEIDHKIPTKRLERDYLIPLLRGVGFSRYVTRMLSLKPWQRPLIYPLYMLNDIRRIILRLLKYNTKIKSDIVAACKLELYISSLISPLYLWKNGYLSQSR
ncbi:MAG: hormogonium polysaccharide biosynthesis glycosyltransferase HpsE [Microcoleaceae cyanobacterium]